MHLDDFDFFLPQELIAQHPSEKRDASRLMIVRRDTGLISESGFASLPDLLRDGDILVINDTKVIPARLPGRKESGGRIEVFLVRRVAGPGEVWHCLVRSSKPPRRGMRILLPEGLEAVALEQAVDGLWVLSFSPPDDFDERLDRAGNVPLPPYIRRPAGEDDRERYQTVYARVKGAVAAPTAGLHMTPELLRSIEDRGVGILPVTLHVGLGTFMPVRTAILEDHRMHREEYHIPPGTAEGINRAKKEGRRVVALGTTSVRALEQASRDDGTLVPGTGEADIFIRPGYRFNIVDAMITNFHLPKSTLLMLVAAFAGKELLFRAYGEAVKKGFRFYSYGDAMFIS